MAWCPKCKNEYVAGITHCPDCDIDLVDTLTKEEKQDEDRNVINEEFTCNPTKSNEKPTFTKTYVEASHREEEMRSSCISFLLVGIILVVLAVLVYMDYIPLAVNAMATKILDVSVLGAIAIIFFFVSGFSYKRAKQLASSSVQEVKLTEEIIQFCLEHYTDTATEDSSETDKYFERENGIRKLISENFKGLTESYLEYLVEIVYNEFDF